MSDHEHDRHHHHDDTAPGDEHEQILPGIIGYSVGLVLAAGLTATSFWVASTHALWGPGVPIGLCVLAIAQMGIHLVFFLHLTSGPDNANNALALAFGTLIVGLVLVGTLWIMAHVNHQHMAADMLQRMQR